jgi:hypothetical protein
VRQCAGVKGFSITKNGRERILLISAEGYDRRDGDVVLTRDLTEEEIEAIRLRASATPSSRQRDAIVARHAQGELKTVPRSG